MKSSLAVLLIFNIASVLPELTSGATSATIQRGDAASMLVEASSSVFTSSSTTSASESWLQSWMDTFDGLQLSAYTGIGVELFSLDYAASVPSGSAIYTAEQIWSSSNSEVDVEDINKMPSSDSGDSLTPATASTSLDTECGSTSSSDFEMPIDCRPSVVHPFEVLLSGSSSETGTSSETFSKDTSGTPANTTVEIVAHATTYETDFDHTDDTSTTIPVTVEYISVPGPTSAPPTASSSPEENVHVTLLTTSSSQTTSFTTGLPPTVPSTLYPTSISSTEPLPTVGLHIAPSYSATSTVASASAPPTSSLAEGANEKPSASSPSSIPATNTTSNTTGVLNTTSVTPNATSTLTEARPTHHTPMPLNKTHQDQCDPRHDNYCLKSVPSATSAPVGLLQASNPPPQGLSRSTIIGLSVGGAIVGVFLITVGSFIALRRCNRPIDIDRDLYQ